MFVTFDSNVWRAAADPSRFPRSPENVAFVAINAAMKARRIDGVLCETVFTLEGIARADRKNFLVAYRPKVKITEEELADGTIKLGFSLGPDRAAHAGNNFFLSSHLTDALGVGFKLMRCPRVAGIQNPDLKDEWFIATSNGYANKFGEVSRRLEKAGAGIAQIKAIGNKYAAPNEPWFHGLSSAPSTEDGAVAKAVAEWADSDSVAAHVANGNAFFCTNDSALAAGVASTFSASNRVWLTADYHVKFLTPTELANHV